MRVETMAAPSSMLGGSCEAYYNMAMKMSTSSDERDAG
jgi:hypothetical protein